MSSPLHGIVAQFSDPADLLQAVGEARRAGYTALNAYTPFPVEGLAEALGFRKTGVPLLTLVGGLSGGLLGLGMQYISAVHWYPLDVGGRPLASWASFVPIAFELTILGAALAAVFGMLALNGLPRPNHPIFETPHFTERNDSHFYLCIESADTRFHPRETAEFLAAFRPEGIWEVPES